MINEYKKNIIVKISKENQKLHKANKTIIKHKNVKKKFKHENIFKDMITYNIDIYYIQCISNIYI